MHSAWRVGAGLDKPVYILGPILSKDCSSKLLSERAMHLLDDGIGCRVLDSRRLACNAVARKHFLEFECKKFVAIVLSTFLGSWVLTSLLIEGNSSCRG